AADLVNGPHPYIEPAAGSCAEYGREDDEHQRRQHEDQHEAGPVAPQTESHHPHHHQDHGSSDPVAQPIKASSPGGCTVSSRNSTSTERSARSISCACAKASTTMPLQHKP